MVLLAHCQRGHLSFGGVSAKESLFGGCPLLWPDDNKALVYQPYYLTLPQLRRAEGKQLLGAFKLVGFHKGGAGRASDPVLWEPEVLNDGIVASEYL